MSDPPLPTLPMIQAALQRLDRAVDRLEVALPRVGATADPRATLAEWQTLRDDQHRLDDAARIVGVRLDGIIERLKSVLGEEVDADLGPH